MGNKRWLSRSRMVRQRAAAAIALAGALVMSTGLVVLNAGAASAGNGNDGTKTGICHRTASDTNPYVYEEVDDESLDAHYKNLAGHPAKYWKSDGTWRGEAHVAGDPKNDYAAASSSDCQGESDHPTVIETLPTVHVVDPCGTANDKVILSTNEDEYTGQDNGDGTATFTAAPGFVFPSDKQTYIVQYTMPTDVPCPPGEIDIPAPPTVSKPDCDSAGSFTVTPHQGMTTFLDGVKVTSATVVDEAGTYTIGYIADPGTVFKGTGKTRATQDVTVLGATGNCPPQTRQIPAAPVPSSPACDVDGSLTLPGPAGGLTWTIQQVSGTPDNTNPYGPGVYSVTVTSAGLPFTSGKQSYTYPDITVEENTGPCVAGVEKVAPGVTFKDANCGHPNRASWKGEFTEVIDYTAEPAAAPGETVTVTAAIKSGLEDEFAFADGVETSFTHTYTATEDLECVKGTQTSRPKPDNERPPAVLGTQAVAPTAVDAGLASLPGSDTGTSATSLLAQLMVAGGLLLLLAGGWLGLGRRETGAHRL